jgi:hypothetical protein
MLSRVSMLSLGGAALLAGIGALFGSAVLTGAGCVAWFAVVAVHPAVRAAPLRIRVLSWAGLLLLAVSVVVHVRGWADPFDDVSGARLLALIQDPEWQRTQYARQVLVASCLGSACACLGGALGYLVRRRWRAVPAPAALTLVALLVLAMSPLLGSFTNMAVGTVVVLGGYGWLMAREVRRHGATPIAVGGAALLGILLWQAVDVARRSWPVPVERGTFVSVAVAVDTGLAVEGAVAVGILLLGAAATVLGCARLSSPGS